MKEKSDSKGTDSLLKYKQYALDVQSGKITANRYIKQATKRYLDWFSRSDMEFRPQAVDRVVNFISKLKHFKGEHAGKQFQLLDFQRFIIANMFGFYWKDEEGKPKNRRVVQYVWFEGGRKNGKTALAAAILLYMMIADGEQSSDVYFLANSHKQALLAYDYAHKFLGGLDPKNKLFHRFRDSIKFPMTNSQISCLAAEAKRLDGLNPHCFLQDEYHECTTEKIYANMCSGMQGRKNPMGIIITSAGFDMNGVAYQKRKEMIEILSGKVQDDSQLVFIYCLDPEDDYKDPKTWQKANPSLGQTLYPDKLQIEVNKASNSPTVEPFVKCKNFGFWGLTDYEKTWLTHDEILNVTCDISLDQFDPDNTIVWLGVDLSSTCDLTALSMMVVEDSDDGKLYYFKTWYFLPSLSLQQNMNQEIYRKAINQHQLINTCGNVVDYDEVTKVILQIAERYTIGGVFYDSYNSVGWAVDATAKGFPLVPFSQSLFSYNRPTKEMTRLVKMGNCRIDNNILTRFCFDNVELKFDHNENCKPVKKGFAKGGSAKVDGVLSMLTALGGYLEQPQFDTSI
nr:MAG TPA: Large Terminase [Caudoviricetes sp.]